MIAALAFAMSPAPAPLDLALEPYRRCIATYVAERMDDNYTRTKALAREGIDHCQRQRNAVRAAAQRALVRDGMTTRRHRDRAIAVGLCRIDLRWDPTMIDQLPPPREVNETSAMPTVPPPGHQEPDACELRIAR